MKYFAKVGEREYECALDATDAGLYVEIAGRRMRADLVRVSRQGVYSLLLDGRSYEFTLHEDEEGTACAGAAGHFLVAVEDARTHAARQKTAGSRVDTGPRVVKAAMPGIVREVRVAIGDTIAKGDTIVILEAMKMQNEVRADRDGTVAAVHVTAEETVEKGARLLEIT